MYPLLNVLRKHNSLAGKILQDILSIVFVRFIELFFHSFMNLGSHPEPWRNLDFPQILMTLFRNVRRETALGFY